MADRAFFLRGYDGSLKNFQGAVVITPEPVETDYMTGAWNYAVHKNAPEFNKVNYDAAIEKLKQNHPDWIVIYPSSCPNIDFSRNRHKMDKYIPPG